MNFLAGPTWGTSMWLRAVCFICVLNSLELVDANGNDPVERKRRLLLDGELQSEK